MEYGEDGSQGSYHTPKLGEKNVVPVPVMEPVLLPADQSFPNSDQENIPPRMVTPPPLNVLVPVEEETRVKECCVTNWHFSRSFHFYFNALTLVVIVLSLAQTQTYIP